MALPTKCTVANPKNFAQVQGTGIEAGTGDTTIIAAGGTKTNLRIQKVVISFGAVVDEAIIALEDGVGGTAFYKIMNKATDSISGQSRTLDFGESGLKLSTNTLLNLTVEAQNAGVTATAVGYIEKI